MINMMKSTLAFKLFLLSSLFFIPFNNLTAKPSCKAGREIVSCQIQGGGSFSVCRVNKHKVLYKFLGKSKGKGKRKNITLYSAPYYSREKYKTASYETLRIHRKTYDYIINSTRISKKRVTWLDVYKNKHKLAKLACTNKSAIKTKGLKLVKDNLASYRDTRLYTEEEHRALTKKMKQQEKQRKQQKAAQTPRKGYAVQLMSTSSKRKARKIQKVFKQEGYKSFISKKTTSGKRIYYVRIGVYKDKKLALQVQQGMKKRYKRNNYVKKSQIVTNKG